MSSEVQGASDGPFGDFANDWNVAQNIWARTAGNDARRDGGNGYLPSLATLVAKKRLGLASSPAPQGVALTLEEFDAHIAYHFAFAVWRWRRILRLFTMGYGRWLGGCRNGSSDCGLVVLSGRDPISPVFWFCCRESSRRFDCREGIPAFARQNQLKRSPLKIERKMPRPLPRYP